MNGVPSFQPIPAGKMKRRTLLSSALMVMIIPACAQEAKDIKLRDYRPESIYAIPVHDIKKAKFGIVDFHTHDYTKTDAELDAWVKTMDSVGIAKANILSYSTGAEFDAIASKYRRYKDRFEIWCGFDYTGYENPGWTERAMAELERCHRNGARGVGELGDKGLGEFYSKPVASSMHIDDPRMQPLLKKCGDLHMPVSVHVAEDAWMYLNADSSNDGLMNAGTWKVDMGKKGILDHDQLVQTLENAVKANPNTIFIACHLANCCSDLNKLAKLFDRYPNLYADIAARYGEISPVPRFTKAFMEKYADRLVYGTDMGTSIKMYRTTFRILETDDEHFYERDLLDYHWPLYGLALSADALRKLYYRNAEKILGK
jgi:predicted TIM-barrel fold metal-dependent hydrolase